MQNHDKKDVLGSTYKTNFIFLKRPLDTVSISLNTDTVKDEVFVQSLKLSNQQTLYFSDSTPILLKYLMLETVDLNFDGYIDIRVLKESGATGNKWYDTWLHSPSTNKWSYNHFLSTACSVSADSTFKRVITYYTGGYTENRLEIYEVKDTLYKPIASLSSEFEKGKFLLSLLDYGKRKITYRDTTDKNIDLYKFYYNSIRKVLR
jgi:hypothetical protein